MKTLFCLLVLAGAIMSVGCATPAYSSHERAQMIGRNWGYDWAQSQDDIDSLLLLRPTGHLTLWNVR